MNSRVRFLSGLSLVVVFVTALSCRRRPLDILFNDIRIVLDNHYDMPYRPIGQKPYHYGVLFYESGEQKLVMEEFCSEPGGPVNGIPGDMRVFVYDLDNSVLRFDGKDAISSFRVYTEEDSASTKAAFRQSREALARKVKSDGYTLMAEAGYPGFENERLIREPDELFTGENPSVPVPFRGFGEESFEIPVRTGYALSQGRVTVFGVKDTRYIYDVQIFVTNLARAKYLGTRQPEPEPASLAFHCAHVGEDYLQGVFNYFGKIEAPAYPNTAYVVITDNSGGKHVLVADITSQITGQRDNADIVLHLDFRVPVSGEGGAFQPAVGNWDVEWYDVVIGSG